MQSAELTHANRHCSPLPSQRYGSQGWPEVRAQEPTPSQRKAWVKVDPRQLGWRQMAPSGYRRQAPDPSQAPSRWQEANPSSGQSCRGSLPTSAGTQVPTVPVSAHDQQAAEQSVPQQTPSKQNPLAQSDWFTHGSPRAIVP
jgi:hypothetical protein